MLVALLALFVALGGSAYAIKKVGTKGLKNNAVTAQKLRDQAVTADKLTAVIGRTEYVEVGNNASKTVRAVCEPGEKLIGGGGDFIGSGSSPVPGLTIESSAPSQFREPAVGDFNNPLIIDGFPFDGWIVTGYNSSGGPRYLTAYATCLNDREFPENVKQKQK